MARSRTCPGPALLLLLDGARITAIATQGGPVMYQPDHFRVDDLPPMHALMRGGLFAARVWAGAAGLYATHLPTVLKHEGPFGTIECHLARQSALEGSRGGRRGADVLTRPRRLHQP